MTATIIGGKVAWENNGFAVELNSEKFGRVLTAGEGAMPDESPMLMAAE